MVTIAVFFGYLIVFIILIPFVLAGLAVLAGMVMLVLSPLIGPFLSAIDKSR